MCGHLPFAERLMGVMEEGVEGGDGVDGGWDPFEREEEDGRDGRAMVEPAGAAVEWLRDELRLDTTASSDEGTPVFQSVPVFLGHGVDDEKVGVVLGRRAAECLVAMKADVCWKEYEGLGHWYSGEMLRDVVDFIDRKTNWHKR